MLSRSQLYAVFRIRSHRISIFTANRTTCIRVRARFQPTPFRFHTRPGTDITITHRMCWVIGVYRCISSKTIFPFFGAVPEYEYKHKRFCDCLNSMRISYLCKQQSVVIHEGDVLKRVQVPSTEFHLTTNSILCSKTNVIK